MNTKSTLYDTIKPKAIELRKQGKTYSEICKELRYIPKSTLSGWFRGIDLSEKDILRIKKLMVESGNMGRHLGAQRNRQKREDRLASIKINAETEYEKFKNESNFIAGLVLYLAEGSKKSESFMFMNSDYKLIQYMHRWVLDFGSKNILDIKFRLYIHELYADECCELFWSETLGVSQAQFLKTIYKPTGRQHKKNPIYKGCLRLEVKGGNELYWKTMTWRDCFYKSL